MSKGTLSKVMKYELRYLDGCEDFHEMQKSVWDLQNQTRTILNRTIQIAYHWDYINLQHREQTGEFLNLQNETGYKRLDGYIYDQVKHEVENMAAANINATIQKAWSKYASAKSEILRGTMSIPSYKRDQPLVLNRKTVHLYGDDDNCAVDLTLFSNSYKKAHGLSSNVRFSVRLNDNTQRTIMRKLLDATYGLGQCQLIYDKPKWFLLVTYNFVPEKASLDPDKILGVDLGETIALYASSTAEYGSLRIDGGEVNAYAQKLEARKRSMQRQAAHCGDGRIGHGTRTRVADVYKVGDRIANFRDTINHRYSKALIEYALKHGFGTIQMEDLTGIKTETNFPKFLRHWTYYDLQSKIEAKAKEHGITIVKIDPQYTSQRCSKCGHIDKGNRTSQARFLCTKCGFSCNADFNSSQNISIQNIAKIIQETLGANPN